jgi:hypothetical protein
MIGMWSMKARSSAMGNVRATVAITSLKPPVTNTARAVATRKRARLQRTGRRHIRRR